MAIIKSMESTGDMAIQLAQKTFPFSPKRSIM